jgi:xanthine dehydrogenase accessory factor
VGWLYDSRMRELLPFLRRRLERGEDVALGVVVGTRRSAPRPVGSALAVAASGEIAGSVSGGCVESEVADEARQVLAGGAARMRTYGITDDQALAIGLPCGGEIDVFVGPAGEELLRRAVAELDAGRVVTPEVDAGRLHLRVKPAPRLVIVGAVELAEAACRAAKPLGWRTIVIDPRSALATRERVPSADELLVEWPEKALERVQPDEETAVLVLAHDDRFDLPALASALASPAFYVGALGSRRTQQRRRERLLELGVDETALDRVHGPCGLDIGAGTTAETAVAVVAEIVAVRAGRTGGSLRDRDTPIHAEVAPAA